MDTVTPEQYKRLIHLFGPELAPSLLELKLRYAPEARVEAAKWLLPTGYVVAEVTK